MGRSRNTKICTAPLASTSVLILQNSRQKNQEAESNNSAHLLAPCNTIFKPAIPTNIISVTATISPS